MRKSAAVRWIATDENGEREMTMSRQPRIIDPSALVSADPEAVRTPPRPAEYREAGYLDKYDATTVFYDVFHCGRKVLAVGPPAGTLRAEVAQMRLVAPGSAPRRFRIDRGLDRVGRFWAIDRSNARDARIDSRLAPEPIPVSEDLSSEFRGRRAVMTVSKDNDLEWVKEWGRWHARHHSADALIVYDNNSTAYSHEELWEALAATPGVKVAAVVAWPFRYGPVTRLQQFWDSDYAQRGALEHARWRLLREAAGFLNADIDELVLEISGSSVFDVAARAANGVLELPGRYTYPAPGTPRGARPLHAESHWIKTFPPEMPSAAKWCVVPARVPQAAQLAVHNVRGVPMTSGDGVRFAHMLNITTDWYGARNSFTVVPGQYEIDEELLAQQEDRLASIPTIPTPRPRLLERRALFNRALGWMWRWKIRLGAR